jgi:hypothetical protein
LEDLLWLLPTANIRNDGIASDNNNNVPIFLRHRKVDGHDVIDHGDIDVC